MFQLYRSDHGNYLQRGDEWRQVGFPLDELFTSDAPLTLLDEHWDLANPVEHAALPAVWLPPLQNQEVWAAGVTYYRSRTARMEESEEAGGDRFYDMVYEADRPELFFKATARRVRGHGQTVGLRADSTWDVPEPELTLAINSSGVVFGAAVGNDMSSRSIEGENPLYLPQAKIYTGSCAIGPCLLVGSLPGPSDKVTLVINRGGKQVFEGSTPLSQLKRSYDELAGFLYRDNDFPSGALLMTGTGIVPDHPFTLAVGDEVKITIDGIGTLGNVVARAAEL